VLLSNLPEIGKDQHPRARSCKIVAGCWKARQPQSVFTWQRSHHSITVCCRDAGLGWADSIDASVLIERSGAAHPGRPPLSGARGKPDSTAAVVLAPILAPVLAPTRRRIPSASMPRTPLSHHGHRLRLAARPHSRLPLRMLPQVPTNTNSNRRPPVASAHAETPARSAGRFPAHCSQIALVREQPRAPAVGFHSLLAPPARPMTERVSAWSVALHAVAEAAWASDSAAGSYRAGLRLPLPRKRSSLSLLPHRDRS